MCRRRAVAAITFMAAKSFTPKIAEEKAWGLINE